AIRVFVVIDMLVVGPVFAGPEENGVLKGSCTEDGGEKTDAPVALKGEVGEEPVIPEGDGKPAGAEHEEKEGYLKPVDPEVPDIDGDGGKGEEQGANQ